MRSAHRGLVLILFLLIPGAVLLGQTTPNSDPQALALAAHAIAALTAGVAINDVTLSGSAIRTVGPDVQTGSATWYAKGQSESRLDLSLSSGLLSEIRNVSANGPQGEWIGPDGTAHPFAQHNCLTDTAWFFPALSSLASGSNPNQVLSYIGLETLNGLSVQHIRSVWFGQQLTQMDFYLDPSSSLPLVISFNAHPDNDSGTNMPMQVSFANYQTTNGIQVPYHIQELFNGVLLLDFTAASVAVNTGLSDSLFTIP